MPYLYMMQGFLSRRCITAWGKISCQAKVPFPLVHACFQDMQQRSNHHPFILVYCATGQNWIPFSSNIHWLNTIFHSKNFCIALSFYPTDFFSAVLMGLLSGPCSLLLPDVQTTASSFCDHCIQDFLGLRTTHTNIFLFQGLEATYHLAKLSSSISAGSTWD